MTPAILDLSWAFGHQVCNRAAPTTATGFLGAGSTGAFPAKGNGRLLGGHRRDVSAASTSAVTGVMCS